MVCSGLSGHLPPDHPNSRYPQEDHFARSSVWTWVYVTALFFACVVCPRLEATLIVNEVLANEPGSDVALEWIELFNTGPDTVELGHYIFVEGDDSTTFADSLVLSPFEFAVLSRRPIASGDETSFESHWGDNSGIWGDHPNEGYLLLAAKFSLKNSADCVWLLDTRSGSVDSVRWDESAPDGVSLERINPAKPANPENLAWSRDVTGCTPGGVNSMIPPDIDLGFIEDSSGVQVNDETGVIYLHAYVRNYGLQPTDSSQVVTFFDRDFSGDLSTGEQMQVIPLPELPPDSCFFFELQFIEPVGRRRLILELSSDGDSLNNRMQIDFAVGDMFVEMRINEFLVNPTEDLGTEWLELVNEADYMVNLLGFAIGDSRETALIASNAVVAPGERVLVCESRDRFESFYGIAGCMILEPSNWVTCPDSDATIVLLNDFGRYSDTLRYEHVWPDNTSWERCEDSTSSSRIEMFHQCTDPSGSTPCAPNSPAPEIAEHDLAFTAESFRIDVPSDCNQPIRAEVEVCNVGSDLVPEVEITAYLDEDFNGSPSDTELLVSYGFDGLPAQECEVYELSFLLPAGHHQLIFMLPADENIEANQVSIGFSIGPETHEIIITEFLADPEGALESEWVECRNNSNHAVDLAGWEFGDGLHTRAFPESVILDQGEYFIIAEDSAAFVDYYGEPCRVIEPFGWSNLNNTGDCISLIDTFGVIADSAIYTATNGDNRSLELNEYSADMDVDDDQWFPSTSPNLSSPCQPNSVSGVVFSEIEVSLPKKVFSPSLGESLEYSLRVPPATPLTIEIFDLAGRKQFTIVDEQPVSSGEYAYAGDSDYRSFLPVGAYIMKVTSDDGSGNAARVVFAVAGSR